MSGYLARFGYDRFVLLVDFTPFVYSYCLYPLLCEQA